MLCRNLLIGAIFWFIMNKSLKLSSILRPYNLIKKLRDIWVHSLVSLVIKVFKINCGHSSFDRVRGVILIVIIPIITKGREVLESFLIFKCWYLHKKNYQSFKIKNIYLIVVWIYDHLTKPVVHSSWGDSLAFKNLIHWNNWR